MSILRPTTILTSLTLLWLSALFPLKGLSNNEDKYIYEYFFVNGLIAAVCEMHHERVLPYISAKRYAMQYLNIASEDLSNSDIQETIEGTLRKYPTCPLR